MAAEQSEDAARRRLSLLVNLIQSSRYPVAFRLTKADIFARIRQYQQAEDPEALFNADKVALEEITGTPIIAHDDGLGGQNEYYWLSPGPKTPSLRFSAAESFLLRQAIGHWNDGAGSPQTLALLSPSLEPAGTNEEIRISVRIRQADLLAAFHTAIVTLRKVTFLYAPAGEKPQRRHLEPWLVKRHHDRFYVHGFDCDREEKRTFALARIRSQVKLLGEPRSFTIPAESGPVFTLPTITAEIRFPQGQHTGLRRLAISEEADGKYVRCILRPAPIDEVVRYLLRAGTGIEVLAPSQLRDRLDAAWKNLEVCDG